MLTTARPAAGLALVAVLLAALAPTPGHAVGVPVVGPTVYVAHGLTDAELIALGAHVAGRLHSVLLLASEKHGLLDPTLRALAPSRIVNVKDFPSRIPSVDARVDRRTKVVLCPPLPRGRLLQAACLAGAENADLWISENSPDEAKRLRALVKQAPQSFEQITLIGETGGMLPPRSTVKVVRLGDQEAVASAYLKRIEISSRLQTAVICNPFDTGSRAMSALGPWLAVKRRAALLLTDATGKNVEAIVDRMNLTGARPRRLEHLILLADLQAIPMEQRPNPIPGDKDAQIDLEPLSPRTATPTPFSYAIGRLFHEDRAVVPLMLARQELFRDHTGSLSALVASNPGGGLNLLETFSRTTSRELANAGYQTTALFGNELTAELLRKALPKADLFLWEGHHSTLIREWGFANWDEPLPPALHFMQSCMVLQEEKVGPLLKRGAVAVVGTSTRTYSGSGGAFSLAYLDAVIHDRRTNGEALRQAKNFLLAYSLLKEKRLGDSAKRTGANLRAAWAFTLWGDPTLRLPVPEPTSEKLPGINHEVNGHTLTLSLPEKALERVSTSKYRASPWPNGRFAGLIRKDEGRATQPLVPLVFAEVELPKVKPGVVPRLSSKVPSSRWVFTWDQRRRVGYLLVMPRATEGNEMRFHIDWTQQVAERQNAGK
jgi:Peptidase family C25